MLPQISEELFTAPSQYDAATGAWQLFAGPLQPSDLLLELVAAARALEWEKVGVLIGKVLPEFQASAWDGLFAPKATPRAILDTLTEALDKALDDATLRKRLLELGSDIPDATRRGPRPLAALVKSEIAKWTPVIKAAGVGGN